MNQEELQKARQDLIYLVACAVKEIKPDPKLVKAMDLSAVFSLAKSHSLSGAAAFAVEAAGFRSGMTTKLLSDVVHRNTRFTIEKEAITQKLKEAGIWYVLLKGAVIKDYYPRPEMREMSDHDILFDASRAKDVKTIMESLGYTTEHFNVGAHDVYFKAPVLNFEMHRMLFSKMDDMEQLVEYFERAADRLLGEGVEKHFSPEDFYIYVVAHEYKHFYKFGTGLRSILDTFVYLSKVKMDEAYVNGEMEKLGLAEFEKKNRSLAMHLFGDGKLTEEDEQMLRYVFSSGTYGNFDNRVSNTLQRKKWSKMRYVLSRVFVPVSRSNPDSDAYAKKYTVFYKYKILLPFLPLYRAIRALRSGRLQKEIRALKKAKRK